MYNPYLVFPMAKTYTIIRTSIFTLLQNFTFTSTPSLIAFPFAVSTLLSQSLISSSNFIPLIHARLMSIFLAAGFPPSSDLFSILNLKLTQTILGFFLLLPFTLSSLLISKASIIRSLHHKQDEKRKLIDIFNPLFVTQLCNSLVILSANATSFCIIVISFNFLDALGLSSPKSILLVSSIGVVIYSIILANAYVICNLSLIISGTQKHGGFVPILQACVLIRGINGTALSLALPINLALAATEALFQYRVVRAYTRHMVTNSSMMLEGFLIAYLYAILLVLDTIIGYLFLKSCTSDYQIDQEEVYSFQIEIQERDGRSFSKVKALEYLP